MTRWLRCAAVPMCVLLIGASAQAQTRGVTAEDYFAFETLAIRASRLTARQSSSSSRPSIRSRTGGTARSGSVPADGSRSSRCALTTAPQSSNSPRWSPDGKAIAFLSARRCRGRRGHRHAAARRCGCCRSSGGEPRRVTNLPNGVSSFQWSPDGTRLVVVSRSGPSDTAKSPSDVRHYKHAELQVQRQRLVRRQARAPVGRRCRVGARDADHLRRRLERQRSAVVARQPRDRVRLRSHRQGVRRGPQHRRLGDRRQRRRR